MAQRWQTSLKINEPAPFSGVLVPNETYRRMSDQDLEYDIINSRYQECMTREHDGNPSIDIGGYALSFSLGIIGGILIKEFIK